MLGLGNKKAIKDTPALKNKRYNYEWKWDSRAERGRGAYVKSANFGDFDWTSDTPANITLSIRMDYAILNY